MLNNYAENNHGGFSNNHGQTTRPTEAQKPQNMASSWSYNPQLEGMYYGGEHQPMYMGTYGSGAQHPNYGQYPSGSIHQPVPTPVVKCKEACCQHYPINPAPLRYHLTGSVQPRYDAESRQYLPDRRTMQASIPRKKVYSTDNTYSGIPDRPYSQYIGRTPALNVADSRQQMPMIRPQYPMYPSWDNRSWVGPRMNCPPSYQQSVNQSAQLQIGLKIPDGSHYMDQNSQKHLSSQHRRVGTGNGSEIIRPIPEPKRSMLDPNSQNCYDYGYSTGFLPFNEVNKIQNGALGCHNNNPSYKIPPDKPYHLSQSQYPTQYDRSVMNSNNLMNDYIYPINYPMPSSNDSHLRSVSDEHQQSSDPKKYDSSITKKKPDIDLRQYLATWDDDEDDGTRPSEPVLSSNNEPPYVVVDCRSLEVESSEKIVDRLTLKPQDSPTKGKAISPTFDETNKEPSTKPRSEVNQSNYAPSMPTLMSDLDKNSTPWNGLNREGEGVITPIGKGGAFQPLDCSKRDHMQFNNQKPNNAHSETHLQKLPNINNDATNLSFDHLNSYCSENRRIEAYDDVEMNNRLAKVNSTSNYHPPQPRTAMPRPCDPRLQQSQENNSSIYSKVAPKHPTNHYDHLKQSPPEGYYNYKQPASVGKFYDYGNSHQNDSNYDYHKYISEFDSDRLFGSKEDANDQRKLYTQDGVKTVAGSFPDTMYKTPVSGCTADGSRQILEHSRIEQLNSSASVEDAAVQLTDRLQDQNIIPKDVINIDRIDNHVQDKTVLVTSQRGPADMFSMSYSTEKVVPDKDNVVTLHAGDQAKDKAVTVEIPYVQQYSSLMRLSEEISQTEKSEVEIECTKNADFINKTSNEDVKKPTCFKLKRLPNSEEWTVEGNSSNVGLPKEPVGSGSAQLLEHSERSDLSKLTVNISSLNMPSLDDIRDGDDNTDGMGENVAIKLTNETTCSSRTSAFCEEGVKTKPPNQTPQMAIVQPMKIQPERESDESNLSGKENELRDALHKTSFKESFDLNQNNFISKIGDDHHNNQPNFSNREISKHENFRSHKKIQRSIADCYSSCLVERDGFTHDGEKITNQSHSNFDINSSYRTYYKMSDRDNSEEKGLNPQIPSSPGVEGMFEDINHSNRNQTSYNKRSWSYQETNSNDMSSMNTSNHHYQTFSNMFIDDMNKRARSDGSILQMSDKRYIKFQEDDTNNRVISKSFEEPHSEMKTSTEKLNSSKKSPPIPPISLKLIESKKIWCITNKDQHSKDPDSLMNSKSLETIDTGLGLNSIETKSLDKSSTLMEQDQEKVSIDEISSGTVKPLENRGRKKEEEPLIEGLLTYDDTTEICEAQSILEVSKSENSVICEIQKGNDKQNNLSTTLNENKCLTIVEYQPPNRMLSHFLSSTSKPLAQVLVFDEKGNNFSDVFRQTENGMKYGEIVAAEIVNEILTKSIELSRMNPESNIAINLVKEPVDGQKLGINSKSVIQFDVRHKNQETLFDGIARTTEKFIQYEKENYQHYSVIKTIQYDDEAKDSNETLGSRSIFSPMRDSDKEADEHSVLKNKSIVNNDTNCAQMDVDEEDNELTEAQNLKSSFLNHSVCDKPTPTNISPATIFDCEPNMSTNDNVKINEKSNNVSETIHPMSVDLVSSNNTEDHELNLLSKVTSSDKKCEGSSKNIVEDEIKKMKSVYNHSCLPVKTKRASVVVSGTMQLEEDIVVTQENDSMDTLSEVESYNEVNPLDKDLALSPESSLSESEDCASDYCGTLKDDEKHLTDCSSVEDDNVNHESLDDDIEIDKHNQSPSFAQFPLSAKEPAQVDLTKQQSSILEDRAKTSVIVINKTCNSYPEYRSHFGVDISPLPLDCSKKSTESLPDFSTSNINSSIELPQPNDGEQRHNHITKSNECISENFSTPSSFDSRFKKFQNFTKINGIISPIKALLTENSEKNMTTKVNYNNTEPENYSKDSYGLLKSSYCVCENSLTLEIDDTLHKLTNPSYTRNFKNRKWQRFMDSSSCYGLGSKTRSNGNCYGCEKNMERTFSIINFGLNEDPEYSRGNANYTFSSKTKDLEPDSSDLKNHSNTITLGDQINMFQSKCGDPHESPNLFKSELSNSITAEHESNESKMQPSEMEVEETTPSNFANFNFVNDNNNSEPESISENVLALGSEETKFLSLESKSSNHNENDFLPQSKEHKSDIESSEPSCTPSLSVDGKQSKSEAVCVDSDDSSGIQDDAHTDTIPTLSTELIQFEKNDNTSCSEVIDDSLSKNEETNFSLLSSPSSLDSSKTGSIESIDGATNDSVQPWTDVEASNFSKALKNNKNSDEKFSSENVQSFVSNPNLTSSKLDEDSGTSIPELPANNDEETLTSENDQELLADSLNEITNSDSSSELCDQSNIDNSTNTDATSPIVTGKDVMFSSRIIQDEEEQLSNPELETTIKTIQRLPDEEEDDDDQDARTDSIKETLRNNQTLSTDTFPLQCLVEAALALENVDSKQVLLNNANILEDLSQADDRLAKLPDTKILCNQLNTPDETQPTSNKSLQTTCQADNSHSLSERVVCSNIEEANYNLRASTRIVTSSSSNIIPYSRRKYCFKTKLNKTSKEIDKKSQNKIKERSRSKKRKGFFSYTKPKKRKRINNQTIRQTPLQEIFTENCLEDKNIVERRESLQPDLSTENKSTNEEGRKSLEQKSSQLLVNQSDDDQSIEVHVEDDVFISGNTHSNPSHYFTNVEHKHDFGGPLIIASDDKTSVESNILCVQVNSQKNDFPHNLNDEFDSVTNGQSFFRDSKTVIESDIPNASLENSTSLVIIIEDLENITENKDCFENDGKRDSDFNFGSIENCTISQTNSDDCSTMLNTELSVNEFCICPTNLNSGCKNGLNKEKTNELLESEHFITNAFINIEDTSYRKYTSCSNPDLVATNCYEEINENLADDIGNWPFVEEEVAEFETNPDLSNTIPENGRKIELKCSIPWKKVFNISKTKKKKNKSTKKLSGLELGPANVEVRLTAPSSEWRVIGDYHKKSSPVVKVSRLILQRESETSSYSEKDSEEENEKGLHNCLQSPTMEIHDLCNDADSFVKDVCNNDHWQPRVLLTRNKELDELTLSLDSKGSSKEVLSPQILLSAEEENFEDFKGFETSSNENADTSMDSLSGSNMSDVRSSSDGSVDLKEKEDRKVKISTYGTYSPSGHNNGSTNDIMYSPSDPHYSPPPFDDSKSSKESVDVVSSSYDSVFSENYENTRLSSYFDESFDKTNKERTNIQNSERQSFLNETIDNTRSSFFNVNTEEQNYSTPGVLTRFSHLSTRDEGKSDLCDVNSSSNFLKKPFDSNTISETTKDTNNLKPMAACESKKVPRKMPKNFFVRKKVKRNKEEIAGSTEASCTHDESPPKKLSFDENIESQEMSMLEGSSSTSDKTCVSTDTPTRNCDSPLDQLSSECETSRLQCAYDDTESPPALPPESPASSERFEEKHRLRDGGRGLKRPSEGHSKEDTKRRKKSTSQFSCPACNLQFETKKELGEHKKCAHSESRELHHCLLCQRTFSSLRRHHLHVQGRSHRHLELTQRHAALSMYRRLTGRECPLLPPLTMAEQSVLQWRPTQSGYSHFYHAPTPLQALLQHQSLETTGEPPTEKKNQVEDD